MVPQLAPHVIGDHSLAYKIRKKMQSQGVPPDQIEAYIRKLGRPTANLRGSFRPGALAQAASPFAAMIPGGGLATTALSALTHGGGRQNGASAPGAIVHPSGGVSIPIEREPPENHDQHMFITYHPAGQVGPVVMRF